MGAISDPTAGDWSLDAAGGFPRDFDRGLGTIGSAGDGAAAFGFNAGLAR